MSCIGRQCRWWKQRVLFRTVSRNRWAERLWNGNPPELVTHGGQAGRLWNGNPPELVTHGGQAIRLRDRSAQRLWSRNPPELVTHGGQAVRQWKGNPSALVTHAGRAEWQGVRGYRKFGKDVYIERKGCGCQKERNYGKEYSSQSMTPRLPDIWVRTRRSS
jgi:hypothetical protein